MKLINLKMKLVFLPLLLVAGFCYSQTKLYIIGTYHEPNEVYNSDTLYNILKNINPDVILYEADSAYFTEDFHFDTIHCKTSFTGIEGEAISQYEKDFNVKIRPYDIEGRYAFFVEHKYFKNETNMFNNVFGLIQENKASPESLADYDMFWSVLSLYKIKDYTIKEINSDLFQKFTELKHSLIHDLLISIVSKNEELSEWKDFALLHKDFWYLRNDAMIENILRMAKEFEGQTIVVITGYEHKYYMINYFNEEKNKKNINLIDYWAE